MRLWKYDPPAPGLTYLFYAKGWIKLAEKVNYESTSDSFFCGGKLHALSGKGVTKPADVQSPTLDLSLWKRYV